MRISKNDVDSFPRFAKVEEGVFVVDSLCFFVGYNIEKLCLYLNSSMATYYYFKNIAALDNGGMQMRQQYIENTPCPPSLDNIEDNSTIFNAFGLTSEEVQFIDSYIEERKQEIVNVEE